MLSQILRAVFSREFVWHLLSWKFLATFVVLKFVMVWLEQHPVLQHANLGGLDAAMASTAIREADRTVVVAITQSDIELFFANTRPVPPDSLLRVVGEIARLEPAVLVIDVFTEDSRYASRRLADALSRVVWAQSADTLAGNVIPVLGGRREPTPRSGFAAMLAEEDGLVRRVRLRFSTDRRVGPIGGIETLPLAAVHACPGALADWCRLARNIPGDTSSVALRTYRREPPFFTLEDVMAAAGDSGAGSALQEKMVVLGFADGSDQIATPHGIRPGPEVVADAIESLLDTRGGIRKMPGPLSFLLDFVAAILVAAVQFSLRRRPQVAALFTLVLIIVSYFASQLLLVWPGYWTNIVPVMVAIWMEQLGEEIVGKHPPKGPPAWTLWVRGLVRRAGSQGEGRRE